MYKHATKRLIFAYIEHHRCLHQVNLNFEPQYDITYNPKTKFLSVFHNEALPADFWPENISSVSVIAGKNGTGKSSILRWLLERSVEGFPVDKLNGIIAIEENGKLKIYHDVIITNHTEFEKDQCLNIAGWEQDRLRAALAIPSIFCAAHFDAYQEYSTANKELSGMRNMSDKWLLIHDLETNRKVDPSKLSYSIGEHLNAYIIENEIRICNLLLDRRFQQLFKKNSRPTLRLPRYIVFNPDTSGDINIRVRTEYLRENYILKQNDSLHQKQAKIEYQRLKLINEVPHNSNMRITSEELGKATLHDFLYASLKNFYYIFAQSEFFNDAVIDFGISLFTDNYNQTNLSVLGWIDEVRKEIDSHSELKDAHGFSQLKGFFLNLAKSMNFISNQKWEYGRPVIDCVSGIKDNDFEAPHDVQTYADIFPQVGDKLRSVMVSTDSFNQRFFTISYSHNAASRSQLSSGELEMLNLYSRIRYALESPMPGGGYERPSIIYLDEVEIGFHPEWQRQFVNKLTQFVSLINQGGKPIQIIYTTHSPITLSDMPKECVNLLMEFPNKESANVQHECKMETFGANVFELYGNSFFMENGLIGEFASEKIKHLNSEIEDLINNDPQKDGEDLNQLEKPEDNLEPYINDIRRRINMIGDKRIKAYLNSRLDTRDRDEEIRKLKDRIAYLEALNRKENAEG